MKMNGKGRVASEIDTDQLRRLMSYELKTGQFFWKISNKRSVKAGDIVGSLHKTTGYFRTKIHGKQFVLHRLAWQYVYGSMPDKEIDHINGIRTDNRICNLRLATNSNNNQNRKMASNNSSGKKGVTWNKSARKWQASIGINGTSKYLGIFKNIDDAHMAYVSAAKKLFGEFARTE